MHWKWESAEFGSLLVRDLQPTNNNMSMISGGVGTSMNEIGQLIRLKERELHEIHDLRCGQLEKLVEERDGVIEGIQNRFDQLKEDFSYNLTLLSARDEELDRLERVVETKVKELSCSESEKRSVAGRLDVLELRDSERVERHDQEKTTSKRILQELKDVIESMRWASEEENKSKQREIDNLREDNKSLISTREESLDCQRRDLTQTFENLLAQREESFVQKEKEFGQQVIQLDGKFEQLLTDNGRLKAELHEAKRLNEKSEEQIGMKEESIRQLQWKIEDERLGRQQNDDTLHRQLNQASLEIGSYKDSASKECAELKNQIEKLLGQAEREEDLKLLTEKRLEEKISSLEKNNSLFAEEIKENISQQQALRDQNEKVQHEYDILSRQRDFLDHELHSLKIEVNTLGEQCNNKESELAKAKQDMNVYESKLSETEDKQNSAIEENEQLISGMKISFTQKMVELEHELKHAKTQIGQNEANIESGSDDRHNFRKKFEEVSAQLKEEQGESAALRLRMRLHETQVVTLTKQIEHNDQQYKGEHFSPEGEGAGVRRSVPPSDYKYTNDYTNEKYSSGQPKKGKGSMGLGIDIAQASSPIFSEDFGPVSLPASPLATPNPNQQHSSGHGQHQHQHNFNYLTGTSQELQPMINMEIDAAEHKSGLQSAHSEALGAENMRLKKTIHEMRQDIETLQNQVMNQSAQFADIPETEKVTSLQKRLERSTAEVVRLRSERKTLMDVGNELRAALNRDRSNSNRADSGSGQGQHEYQPGYGGGGQGGPGAASVSRGVSRSDRENIPRPPVPSCGLSETDAGDKERDPSNINTVNADTISMVNGMTNPVGGDVKITTDEESHLKIRGHHVSTGNSKFSRGSISHQTKKNERQKAPAVRPVVPRKVANYNLLGAEETTEKEVVLNR